ncbi:MAG: glycine cleavage system aminomethyltransferase GcvT [Chloroflexi bacterium]|nr:glycine cleavage system aminomethyltransferase GcvT [Chloroflexota bacterium]
MTQHLSRTALYDTHVALDGRMVPFAGWEMPLQFQGILAEARAVRATAGLFDVSHMGRIWLRGAQAADLLDWVTTADVPSVALNRARYTLVCNEAGGIIDDCIFYRLGDQEYLLIANAANRDAVWSWLQHWRTDRFLSVELDDRTLDVGMIAFQGPQTPALLDRVAPGLADELRPFRCAQTKVAGVEALVGRTGYTGEDGFEIMPAMSDAPKLWSLLQELGAVPCGLGARDVLRLEAGLLLHGTDMDVDRNPIEAGLERFVALDSESVCAEALRRILRSGPARRLAGFQMVGRGIARHGYAIVSRGEPVGEVTSGGYSPTLDRSIGLGYVASELAPLGSRLSIDIRGKLVDAETVALPFYSRRRA